MKVGCLKFGGKVVAVYSDYMHTIHAVGKLQEVLNSKPLVTTLK